MKLYMEKHYKVLSLGKICVNLQCLLLGEKKCLLFQARFDSSPLCYRCCQLSLHLQQSLSGTGQAGYGGAVVKASSPDPPRHTGPVAWMAGSDVSLVRTRCDQAFDQIGKSQEN